MFVYVCVYVWAGATCYEHNVTLFFLFATNCSSNMIAQACLTGEINVSNSLTCFSPLFRLHTTWDILTVLKIMRDTLHQYELNDIS